MKTEISSKLVEIEAAARKSSRIASFLIACGLVIFICAMYYSSSQLTEMETSLAKKRKERDDLVVEIATLKKERQELEAYKVTSDASAEENKLRAAEDPPKPSEIQAAEVPATHRERKRIDRLVENLFSHSETERTAAYTELTNALRAKDYAAERILERGSRELAKLPDQPDSVGLYNTIVTLTDMSRAVTQKPEIKGEIDQYADRVAQAVPTLQKRVDTLKRWLETQRR